MTPSADALSRVTPVFGTPLLQRGLPEAAALNAELAAWALQLRSQSPGVRRTNAGGWHSEKLAALADQPKAVQAFLAEAQQALSDWAMATHALPQRPDPAAWRLEFWANVNQRGHHNLAHDHFKTGWAASAVYYVATGGPEAEGHTVFLNQYSLPAFVATPLRPRQAEHAVVPQDGLLLVFPSWLGHRVTPYQGEGERITLALNAGHPDLPVARQGDRTWPAWLNGINGLRRLLRR